MNTMIVYSPVHDKNTLDVAQAIQITEWKSAAGSCGETGFKGVNTNLFWCRAEVDRLAEKGIVAAVLQCGTECCVARFA